MNINSDMVSKEGHAILIQKQKNYSMSPNFNVAEDQFGFSTEHEYAYQPKDGKNITINKNTMKEEFPGLKNRPPKPSNLKYNILRPVNLIPNKLNKNQKFANDFLQQVQYYAKAKAASDYLNIDNFDYKDSVIAKTKDWIPQAPNQPSKLQIKPGPSNEIPRAPSPVIKELSGSTKLPRPKTAPSTQSEITFPSSIYTKEPSIYSKWKGGALLDPEIASTSKAAILEDRKRHEEKQKEIQDAYLGPRLYLERFELQKLRIWDSLSEKDTIQDLKEKSKNLGLGEFTIQDIFSSKGNKTEKIKKIKEYVNKYSRDKWAKNRK